MNPRNERWLRFGSVGLMLVVALTLQTLRSLAEEPTAAPKPLTEAERAAIEAELEPLEARLARLRTTPGVSADLWADAQIFLKGVRWALDFGPVTDEKSRAMIRKALVRGRERTDALAAGKHPWSDRQGRLARGFVSEVDGSVQPYGLIVPKNYDPAKPIRLDVVLHGSTPVTGTAELLLFHYYDGGDEGDAGATSSAFIELYPQGRLGENAYRFEGETEVFEAIESVARSYNIDRSRIVLRGGSLGGVGTWAIGLKRPDRFVAIGPMSGPVDTREFANSPWEHFERLAPLQPWQEPTLHLVDAIDYTANAAMVPVVAAMGDQDPYYSSHLLIEKAFAKEGIPFVGLVDRGAGHSITQEMARKQLDMLGEIAAKGKEPFPKRIRFVTWTLKFNRCDWIEVLGLGEHYQRAEIEAQRDEHGSIDIGAPKNITRFAIHPPATSGAKLSVSIAGTEVPIPAGASPANASTVFAMRDGQWICEGALESVKLRGKAPGLQGPIDDAFSRSFLCVRGTGKTWHPAVGAWADANLRRFAHEWRHYYRADLPLKDDVDVTEEDLRRSNLILFGDPSSNRWIARILPQLPVEWNRETIHVGTHTFPAADRALELIQPNPLPGAEGRYVVLNSGHTYHDAELRFSYMVFPRLGDWGVVKVGENRPTDPPRTVAETVEISGFFDESWGIPRGR